MADRPSHLAERMSNRREATFTLPVDAARAKVREFLNQPAQGGYSTIVDQWRQLPDGQIEFTTRRFRTTD
jgi:hypothetical protein